MKLIVKVFPEITIKSRPVRKQFIRQLGKNIRAVLRDLDPELRVDGVWDNLEVETQVSEGVITSSPGCKSSAISATCIPAVAELTAMAC